MRDKKDAREATRPEFGTRIHVVSATARQHTSLHRTTCAVQRCVGPAGGGPVPAKVVPAGQLFHVGSEAGGQRIWEGEGDVTHSLVRAWTRCTRRYFWMSLLALCVVCVAMLAYWACSDRLESYMERRRVYGKITKIANSPDHSPAGKGRLLLPYLRPGLTAADLLEVLGSPDFASGGNDGFEGWTYVRYDLSITLQYGRVQSAYVFPTTTEDPGVMGGGRYIFLP